MLNICWGGTETNQIGTHEFIDFCRQVRADPLIAVNMEAEGNRRWSHPANGDLRAGSSEEAAEWIDYCNNPSNAARRANGASEPFDVRLWQIGNETSYGNRSYDCETAAMRTLAFAQAMHRADPTIELIGWGDSGWARRMLEVAGEELQYIAFHHHFNSGLEDSPLQWNDYRRDPSDTWRHLMNAYRSTEAKIQEMRDAISGHGVGLALTESHFGLPGRNRCAVLSTWAAGVANARVLNVHARNGDVLKIATLADFCGTRWMSMAIMIPGPLGGYPPYMMPVARVMALYGHHSGKSALDVASTSQGLDVTASRTEDVVYLHVVNTLQTAAVRAALQVAGCRVVAGRAFQIAADPMIEVDQSAPDLLSPVERPMPDPRTWEFPAASVTAIELQVEDTRETTDQG
jgi:alpha-L-arabinofuranosidase